MAIAHGRRLAEATSCWLHHEYLCNRAGLFDEAALKAAVGQILSTFMIDKPARCRSNQRHEALAAYPTGGRRLEVDFLLSELDGAARGPTRVAVEAKWADSRHCTAINMAGDILRLAVLHRHLMRLGIKSTCIFLLAGTKTKMKSQVANALFMDPAALPLKQDKLSHYHGERLAKTPVWADAMKHKFSESLSEYLKAEGVPNFNASFHPGLPRIALTKHSKIDDSSVKFHAMAWQVASE